MCYMRVTCDVVNSTTVIAAFYDRLVTRDKAPKVALTACMRKLLVMCRDNLR